MNFDKAKRVGDNNKALLIIPCLTTPLVGNSNPYEQHHWLRSSEKELLTETHSVKTYGDRAFSRAGLKLWNKLSLSIRHSNTLSKFKSSIKTELFKEAYGDV